MYMEALNRAFNKAFEHSDEDDNIAELLVCLGQELGCDRISIFEENEEGSCDNTYEWCKPGVMREQLLLQHIAITKFDTWHDRLIEEKAIVVRSPEELIAHDPDVYAAFLEQGINAAIVVLLAFHGRNFGFCILENPAQNVMDDKELIMPGIRYILSSMIYSSKLITRLKRIGYTDSLTGVGNRVSLREHLEQLEPGRPISVTVVDVIGWDDGEGKLPHQEKEQTLLRAGETLGDLFDEEHVFRVDSGEFVVIESGADKAVFEMDLHNIRGLFREYNLLAAVSGRWEAALPESVDEMIQDVHRKAEQEKRTLLEHRSNMQRRGAADAEISEKADIRLPRGDVFFRAADRFLATLFEEAAVAIVTDINYFNLYNDIFGRSAGNTFLENIAEILQQTAEEHHGICGYIGGDNFCLVIPTREREQREIVPLVEQLYSTLRFPDGFYPAMGVYYSDDRRETMITLYDRALNALSEIKGDYMRHIHVYNAEAHRHQKEDKLLLMQVKNGLQKGEFLFYVQPQVHERTGKIIGGEALVRWRHEGQLISPGRFIPVLEKTGYVYAVDQFVWDAVAAWQRSLLDRGIKPVPVSVNVSRVDFYFGDIAERFISLIHKYDLDPELIGVEITESAFTDDIETILNTIKRLHEAGFHVLMDDFGSGSSSLSMLHTMNLDVLKTDVQFMSRDTQDSRAISIVESVISMAHLIGMSVVTEGVETEEQKENLIAMGDNFAQGFYFYRPMPKEQFEELIRDPANVGEGYKKGRLKAASQLRFREMIKEGLVSETLLDNIIRAAAIYREEAGRISLVQVNDRFSALTGIGSDEEAMGSFADHLSDEDYERLRALLQEANAHPLGGYEGTLCFRTDGGESAEYPVRVFLLYSTGKSRMYMSTMG